MKNHAAEVSSPVKMLDLAAQRKKLDGRIENAISDVLAHGSFISGKEVEAFEEWLIKETSFKFAVGVSSGTDALLMALMADGITAGDAVFLPAFTYVATAEIVILLGAHPVFVDVDPETYQISPKSLVEKIEIIRKKQSLKPKAIIGVDLFGQPAPWRELYDISQTYDLKLYNDCAQSFGAIYDGSISGKLARATTLSFFPAKPLGAYGDGGALLTDNAELAQSYYSLRSHGKGGDPYEIIRIGLNARLDTMQAAILLAKTHLFHEERLRRQKNAFFYNKCLPSIFKRPSCIQNAEGAWSVYTILLPEKMDRAACRELLAQAGIATAIYYAQPLHFQKAYKDFHDGSSLPVSEFLCDHVLALPVHAYLTQADLERVVMVLRKYADDFGK